jgi:8-oxo-dGTP pyrophosphatase MutT (NUDIX family)
MRSKEFTNPGSAGILLYAEDTGRYGLQQRSDSVNDPGVWAAWGGGRKSGESLEQCALRELAEESGYQGPVELEPLAQNSRYVTFIGRVPREFAPTPNAEVKDHCWVDAGAWPSPMHPGMAVALENIDTESLVPESQTAKTGIMQTDVYGSRAYHARCLEPGCNWESRRYDRIQQAQAAAKKHAETHFDKKAVAEGSAEAEKYRAQLLKTAPRVMDFLAKTVKGWRPSEQEMLGAIDTAYMVMKHTGDVQQAGKAMMDELNTLHRMSQGQQGVAEASRNSGYKEIEFVCANPEFPEATDPKLQKQMYAGLQQIPGVIPLFQDQSDWSEGQYSLTAIYKDRAVRGAILKLAKQLGVQVDLEQPVSDDYVDRAIRGEHEGQQRMAENFADGRKPGRKGLAKRVGVNCKQPESKLRSIAKNSSGERQRMAHWCANMKSGKKK